MAKTYESYKDSGIAWIGEIPSEWKVGLVGRYFNEIKNPNINQEEKNTLQFKMGDIISKKRGDSKYNPETIEAYNVVEPGTIMINGLNLSFDFISQRVGQVHEKGAITSTYLALYPSNGMMSDYAKYLLKAYDNCKALHAMGRGLRATLSYGIFRSEPILIPSIDEQHSIASFLDTKCGEIDSLISLQEEMISELQAYKQSVITEAVTKGLDPNAKMKDSGVEWIGEIPENWKVSKVGLQYNVILGKMLCPKQLNDDYTLEKYYCAANVHFNGIEGELKKMWFSSLDKETYLTKKGDLLVVEGGAGAGGCAIVNDDESPVYIQNYIMIVRPKLINDVRYLRYQIEQFVKRGYIDVVCNKATIPHFTKDKVSNMQIPLPSFEVQQQIANYLDAKTSQIDSLISLKQQKIDELKSYKKSIIYEYVTGKKRV